MVARQFGNADTLMVVKSRGYGKTWLTALCCLAMGVLYPGSLIAVVSGTAEQATLIVKKIQDYFIPEPNWESVYSFNASSILRLSRQYISSNASVTRMLPLPSFMRLRNFFSS